MATPMMKLNLEGVWTLVIEERELHIPITIPGDDHSALIKAGVIGDPYDRQNELDVQWVGRTSSVMHHTFSCTAELAALPQVTLDLESVDTFADVYLNETFIGSCSNMFRSYRFVIHDILKEGVNVLSFSFRSAQEEAQKLNTSLPYPIPAMTYPIHSPHRNLVRKAQCHSGWDWGPCLMVKGIYDPPVISGTPLERIEYVHTNLTYSDCRWSVEVIIDIDAVTEGSSLLSITCAGVEHEELLPLKQGYQEIRRVLHITGVDLWWPSGYGEQPLYTLCVHTDHDAREKKIGFRMIEVDTSADAEGSAMTFRVNGKDVFCKGANWIPTDALPARSDRNVCERLLLSAKEANMNMIRVWGGGRYEPDYFYELCDSLGLLVWQDMMFSCALYPSEPWFLQQVKEEVIHQVKRLKDHPSIALWCGNNEDVGALTWFEESRTNRDRYLIDYDRLNEGVIGSTVRELDPTRQWWPSSPSAGTDDYRDNWHDDSRGDMHYWSVWHEGKPFEAYREVTPRFCSEFGFQSFPSVPLIHTFCPSEQLNISSPVMEHHQRNDRGNTIITSTFSRYFRYPSTFDHQVYLSQIQQALAITTAVEYWRSRRPVCMGALYWQLNDLWPVASWSSIEYGGTWKPLHYAAKRFYAPVLITMQEEPEGNYEVYGVNDTSVAHTGTLTVERIAFTGEIGHLTEKKITVPQEASSLLLSIDTQGMNPSTEFLRATFTDSEQCIHETVTLLSELKKCDLKEGNLMISYEQHERGVEFLLDTDVPLFFLTLSLPGWDGHFSDNCFHLIPGRPRRIQCMGTNQPASQLCDNLEATHLRNTY